MQGERIFMEQHALGVYEVRSDGSVWKLKRKQQVSKGVWDWVEMTPKKIGNDTPYGHLNYGITVNRKAHNLWLHRVVYRVLCGDIPDGLEINHINGDASDNRPENLELVTHAENMRHRDEVICTTTRGEACCNARLTEDDVREIRRAYTGRRGYFTETALKHGVSRATVEDAYHRRTWKHVS